MRHPLPLAGIALLFALPCMGQTPAIPPFYNTAGVLAYQPIINVVPSGTAMAVRPTVSADRKYVTLSIQAQQTQVIRLQSFTVVAGLGGVVGGVQTLPDTVAALANANISLPVQIQTGAGGKVLNRPGMTRILAP